MHLFGACSDSYMHPDLLDYAALHYTSIKQSTLLILIRIKTKLYAYKKKT